jgi:hypothetical protein
MKSSSGFLLYVNSLSFVFHHIVNSSFISFSIWPQSVCVSEYPVGDAFDAAFEKDGDYGSPVRRLDSEIVDEDQVVFLQNCSN